MKSVDTECRNCRGCGVTRDRRDPKGLGVICGECGGTGKREIYYKPFTKRKKREGIDQVTKLSAELGAIGFGGTAGPRISYMEFLDGKMPEDAVKFPR